MSYDNLSSVSQNILKFYQQLTGEERRVPFILVGTFSNVLVMEIGWVYYYHYYKTISQPHKSLSLYLYRHGNVLNLAFFLPAIVSKISTK
jgi:hypothetical protein